jgi:hypothetical protein
MATKIVKHDWNGYQIRQQPADGFVNLTDMCKTEGRRVGDFLDLPTSKAYISALAADLGLLPENLVIKNRGRYGDTVAHPEVAIECARWVNMEFHIWANRTLRSVIAASEITADVHPMLAWGKVRLTGKDIRRSFTDVVKEYIDRHPELSTGAVAFMYPNASDLVNLSVFGRKAKALSEDWKVDRNTIRDHMTPRELQWIAEVEDLAARLVEQDEINPCDAVKIARERLSIAIVPR